MNPCENVPCTWKRRASQRAMRELSFASAGLRLLSALSAAGLALFCWSSATVALATVPLAFPDITGVADCAHKPEANPRTNVIPADLTPPVHVPPPLKCAHVLLTLFWVDIGQLRNGDELRKSRPRRLEWGERASGHNRMRASASRIDDFRTRPYPVRCLRKYPKCPTCVLPTTSLNWSARLPC